jgi:hypothetical protein
LKRRALTFPTFGQATLKLRAALGRPEIEDRLAQVISTEPLLAARLVRMANATSDTSICCRRLRTIPSSRTIRWSSRTSFRAG